MSPGILTVVDVEPSFQANSREVPLVNIDPRTLRGVPAVWIVAAGGFCLCGIRKLRG